MKRIDPIGTSRKIAAIPYYGGKFRLARHIVPIIESIPHKVYCEPCIGGASVFLWRDPSSSKVEVINDINSDIVTIYRAFKLYPKSTLRSIDGIPYSVELYKESTEIRKRSRLLELSKKDLILIATCSYFNILTTFGNINRASAINIDRNGRNHNANQWQNKKKILKQIINRFESVHIENTDLLDVIKRWDSVNTLFYIDPPYVGSDNDGYKYSEYSALDFSNLVDVLNDLKGSYILSTSQQKTEPSNAVKLFRPIQNGINGSETREEILYIKSPVIISSDSFRVCCDDR